eukprot:TRINITY_DN19867_c0_g1_i2.p1 TRINITY_DN19867_c0_g1~~TRINITY_DN19867_c0_g1_i2.p1  ORF type:complete len:264 (+),score=47.59 TRINITY_DN19867_c0_g1_i2:189-980(+)
MILAEMGPVSRGGVVGVLTENDIVTAYAEATPWMTSAVAWLSGAGARLPPGASESRAVPLDLPLRVAAAKLRTQAFGARAARHLLVTDADGSLVGVLSCLDIVYALLGSDSVQGEGFKASSLRGQTAGHVMKTRAVLPTCTKNATFGEVSSILACSHQNCVLIADDAAMSPNVVGAITSRDILNAFAARIPASTKAWNQLRGPSRSLWSRMVKAETPLAEVAGIMAADAIHHVVVTSAYNSQVILGVVSSSDLVHAAGCEGTA